MEPGHPQWYEVVIGSASVIAGCVVASAAVLRALRGAVLSWVAAAGAILFVAGVAGQRTFPTAEELHRLGAAAARSAPGPWEAGVGVPLIGVRLTPVALVGVLLTLVGLSLVLLMERVGEREEPLLTVSPADLEEGDAV